MKVRYVPFYNFFLWIDIITYIYKGKKNVKSIKSPTYWPAKQNELNLLYKMMKCPIHVILTFEMKRKNESYTCPFFWIFFSE